MLQKIDGLQYASSTAIFDVLTRGKCMCGHFSLVKTSKMAVDDAECNPNIGTTQWWYQMFFCSHAKTIRLIFTSCLVVWAHGVVLQSVEPRYTPKGAPELLPHPGGSPSPWVYQASVHSRLPVGRQQRGTKLLIKIHLTPWFHHWHWQYLTNRPTNQCTLSFYVNFVTISVKKTVIVNFAK